MLKNKARIAVLVSGGGTNLQAILDAEKSGIIHSGEVVLVISNNKDAYALTRAANAGIQGLYISKKELKSQAAFEAAVVNALEEYRIDLIVLAGFMSILSADFTARRRWSARVASVNFARGRTFFSFSKSATEIAFSKPTRRPAAPLPPNARRRSASKRFTSRTLSAGATRWAIGMYLKSV